MSEISEEAKLAARSILEYDLMGVIAAHSIGYLKGELPFESDIQSAIDAATTRQVAKIADLVSENLTLKSENAALRRLVAKQTDIMQRHTCNIGQAPDECQACCEADDAIREGLEVGR